MTSGLFSQYTAGLQPANADERPFAALMARQECIAALGERKAFDLVVCGGGLTAAMAAHQLALEGLRVLVLETGFFGGRGLSWRHSFARSLATSPLDVVRGYRAISRMCSSIAPHVATIVTAEPHVYPSWRGRLGARALQRAWREVGGRLPGIKNGFPDLDEVLLTREFILAARQEGAVALAHVEPIFAEPERESGCYTVGFRDLSSLKELQVTAGGILVDPTDGILPPTRLGSQAVAAPEPLPCSVHRVFAVEPRALTAGSRFSSFELSDGSVATVSRVAEGVVEVVIVCAGQLLSAEAAQAVAEDACHQSGWAIRALVSAWSSGRRFSAARAVARRGGILTVQERGPWDAAHSAATIVRTLLGMLPNGPSSKPSYSPRLLPGAERACELDAFRALARSKGIGEGTIELVIQRWRGRVRYIEEFEEGFREVVPGVLQGEVDLAVLSDQAETIDDLCFAALKIHYCPGWQASVATLAERLAAKSKGRVESEAIRSCVQARSA